ncbi:hypothetical protein J2Y58_004118 [Sphingomonas sp. BE138]|uniref:hypothetical protein n=1 Tax=Sphingomonas sp. BE138 TaxID=2817845 RepID=UPI0028571D93|nr:hypothetical protein [Sphingomonas sp. BE138]MDR6790735.1 hypothetical protein [Sphingomonas sp. BE138]
MGLFDRIASFFDDWHAPTAGLAVGNTPTINPVTGLPMTGGVDVAGNPFGTDLSSHHHDHWQHDPHRSGSAFDDHYTGWHDPFPTGMGGGHDPWRD